MQRCKHLFANERTADRCLRYCLCLSVEQWLGCGYNMSEVSKLIRGTRIRIPVRAGPRYNVGGWGGVATTTAFHVMQRTLTKQN